jgi:hypothetical protein
MDDLSSTILDQGIYYLLVFIAACAMVYLVANGGKTKY